MIPTSELPESAATAAGHTRGLSFGIIASVSRDLHETAVPAKAGTHLSASQNSDEWIPAFAGMTTIKPQLPSPRIMNRHRAIERALPLAALERRAEPCVDIRLHRWVAREHVGLFEPGERRCDRACAEFRMKRCLMVGFEPVGDHHIGAAGDQLVEHAGIVDVMITDG